MGTTALLSLLMLAPTGASWQPGEVVIPYTDDSEDGQIWIDPVTGDEYYNHPIFNVRINLNPPNVDPPPIPTAAPSLIPNEWICETNPLHANAGESRDENAEPKAHADMEPLNDMECHEEEDVGENADAVHIHTEEFPYGHWTGIMDWYRVTNDQDPNNRYYITNTRWFGQGTSGNPEDHGIHHITNDEYHQAWGDREDGNTFFRDFGPLDEEPREDSWSYNVGVTNLGVSYSWSQEGPARLRYNIKDIPEHPWDAKEYSSRASFDVASAESQTTQALEWAAAGVVPSGGPGYAWLRMFDHSKACGFVTCDDYFDETGWHMVFVDWP